jgi:mono/diheme cytochrome c family protein
MRRREDARLQDASMRFGWVAAALCAMVVFTASANRASASEPVLSIEIGAAKHNFTRTQLLDSPWVTQIDVARDESYKRPMHYHAIPMDRLLAGMDLPSDQILEAVAMDGFAGMLPADLALRPGADAARAYLAIELPDAPWPPLSGKSVSAGPFYVVWTNPEASGIRSEQWPYQVTAIRGADSPAKRWPELSVDPSLPVADPIRAGQTLFSTQCLVCHQLNGAGTANVGPDLNRPENPTEYFQNGALKRYIRSPAALRHWPTMQMQGFDKDALSDREIDEVIAYLAHMAGRKTQ